MILAGICTCRSPPSAASIFGPVPGFAGETRRRGFLRLWELACRAMTLAWNRPTKIHRKHHPACSACPRPAPERDKPPADTADHAEDFSWRYAEDLDILAGQVMMELGLSDEQMGARDPDRNREIHSFFPGERTGGGVSPTGQVTLDSGLMNPDLMSATYDVATQALWRRT